MIPKFEHQHSSTHPSSLDVSYDRRKLLTRLVHSGAIWRSICRKWSRGEGRREITLLTCENFWSRICCLLRFMRSRTFPISPDCVSGARGKEEAQFLLIPISFLLSYSHRVTICTREFGWTVLSKNGLHLAKECLNGSSSCLPLLAVLPKTPA